MSKQIESTPRQDGFRMPGEHEPQSAVWMIWPERCDNWRYGAKRLSRPLLRLRMRYRKPRQ